MKIAIDCRSIVGKKDGKGWYTFYVVKNLLELDKKNEYHLFFSGEFPFKEFDGNVILHDVRKKNIFWHIAVLSKLKKIKPDVYFAPTSFIIPAFIPGNIRSVITVHDLVALMFSEGHNFKASFIEKLLLKRALKKAYKVVAISENTKNDLIKLFPFSGEKIVKIFCGVSDDFKILEKEKIDQVVIKKFPEKFFMVVGTICPRKNHINIIKAFSAMNRDKSIKLVVIGQKGWKWQDVFKTVDELNMKNDVIFYDYLPHSDIIAAYNLSLALLFPSFYEGFGLPPLEAMKCGCPVISSNVSSLPEVMDDAGILVDPHDVNALRDAMERILQNEDLRKNLKIKGFENVKRFSWKKSADEILKTFE